MMVLVLTHLLSIFCTFPELPSNIYGYICASGVFPGHAFSCMDTSSASVASPQIQDLLVLPCYQNFQIHLGTFPDWQQ